MSSLTNTFGGNTLSHSYTYDANGNILSDGTTSYTYDSQNQLVWEYNTAAGKAWNYAYDLGGNILSKTEYDYADGQTSNPVTVSYTYGDATWRDLLTAYNGEAITYDGIGNPTSYRGWGMSWQGGRQLASMQKDGTSLSFAYSDAGLRTEKTVNGSTRRYVWNSSQLMADIGASDAFYFHYSSGGELIGYTYKTADAETECILVKNQQGDVEKVIAADGTILASYTYDAWGSVLTADGSLAASNPIRYRGYYFDAETGLYYLQSRYYDSAVGRFINADGCVTTNLRGLLSANAFAYCENTPVNAVDSQGQAMMRDTSLEMMGGMVAVPLLSFTALLPTLISYLPAVSFPRQNQEESREAAFPKQSRDPIHHVVAKADRRAAEAREILREVGIEPLTDPRNLLILPKNYHASLHTSAYYEYVNEKLQSVRGDTDAVTAMLALLKAEILIRSVIGIRWD